MVYPGIIIGIVSSVFANVIGFNVFSIEYWGIFFAMILSYALGVSAGSRKK